jgi:hypothetical protein
MILVGWDVVIPSYVSTDQQFCDCVSLRHKSEMLLLVRIQLCPAGGK